MSLPAPWQSMNRTCASTAIDRRRTRRLGRIATALLVMLFAGASCTAVRPVAKIGLIAPFEGLYRETGYEALDALRAAIEACAPAGVDVLPLALDDSNRPDNARRAAAKLLLDPTTAAVIGPYGYDTTIAASQELSASRVNWLAPLMLGADGRFAAPDGDLGWLARPIAAITVAAESEGAQQARRRRSPQEWHAPLAARLAEVSAPIPVRLLDPDAGDAVDPGARRPSVAGRRPQRRGLIGRAHTAPGCAFLAGTARRRSRFRRPCDRARTGLLGDLGRRAV